MATRVAERFEDMSVRGRLRLLQQDDGDIVVAIITDPDSDARGLSASVEFCTSGGHSFRTLTALKALMEAMARDNRENTHCPRRGERGLGVDE